MKLGATAAAVAIALLVFWYMTGSPQHYVCKGVITGNGTDDSRPSGEISAIFDVIPGLNRQLFGSEDYGHVAIHNHRHMLRIRSISVPNVILTGEGRAFGVFDRVSRRLIMNTGQEEYDLICRETNPAAI